MAQKYFIYLFLSTGILHEYGEGITEREILVIQSTLCTVNIPLGSRLSKFLRQYCSYGMSWNEGQRYISDP